MDAPKRRVYMIGETVFNGLCLEMPNAWTIVGFQTRDADQTDAELLFASSYAAGFSHVVLTCEREKTQTGCRYTEKRDNAAQRYPAMLPWHDLTEAARARLFPERPGAVGLVALSDSEKQKDRDQFDGVPAMLKTYGYAVFRCS